jgi:hypothetical protein
MKGFVPGTCAAFAALGANTCDTEYAEYLVYDCGTVSIGKYE